MTDTPSASVNADAAPRLNRRQAAKIRTRQKVLDAARDLFARHGYDAATIRDIARGAGMSTGAVFANFQDKAELFETVFSEEMARTLDVLKSGAAIEGAVRERLLGALNAGYHHSLEHLPLMQAVIARSWMQPVDAERRSRTHIRPLVEVFADVLRQGVAQGELKQDMDVSLAALAVWDAYIGNFRFAAYDGMEPRDLDARMGRQLDMILAGARARA